jgi:hypothetical protein
VPYPLISSDKLLIAVFDGFFLGAGIGMAIRGGSVIDGTEVPAIYLSKNLVNCFNSVGIATLKQDNIFQTRFRSLFYAFPEVKLARTFLKHHKLCTTKQQI